MVEEVLAAEALARACSGRVWAGFSATSSARRPANAGTSGKKVRPRQALARTRGPTISTTEVLPAGGTMHRRETTASAAAISVVTAAAEVAPTGRGRDLSRS